MEVKQVIVIRKDLRMRRGKEIAQGAHASMAWLRSRMKRTAPMVMFSPEAGGVYETRLSYPEEQWIKGSFAKVTCQVDSLEELLAVEVAAREAGLEVRVVTDAGRTEFHDVPTTTCLAVGPDYAEKIDKVTGHLALY